MHQHRWLTCTLAALMLAGSPAFAREDAQHGHDGPGHQHHGQNISSTAYRVQLNAAQPWRPGTAQTVTLEVRDAAGQLVSDFAVAHEKLMHLIVVSNDLTYFDHVHPDYRGGGRFAVNLALPRDGRYTLFADYLPRGATGQLAALPVQVGKVAASTASPLRAEGPRTRTVADLSATLDFGPQALQPGRPTQVTFTLKDAAGRPVADLQPYLGAMGHLVVIRQAPTLTAANYLHAHPTQANPTQTTAGAHHAQMAGHDHQAMMQMAGHDHQAMMAGHDHQAMTHADHSSSNAAPGQVRFETTFPEPGVYKLWGQFQRNGRLYTVDFTVGVQAAGTVGLLR